MPVKCSLISATSSHIPPADRRSRSSPTRAVLPGPVTSLSFGSLYAGCVCSARGRGAGEREDESEADPRPPCGFFEGLRIGDDASPSPTDATTTILLTWGYGGNGNLGLGTRKDAIFPQASPVSRADRLLRVHARAGGRERRPPTGERRRGGAAHALRGRVRSRVLYVASVITSSS